MTGTTGVPETGVWVMGSGSSAQRRDDVTASDDVITSTAGVDAAALRLVNDAEVLSTSSHYYYFCYTVKITVYPRGYLA